MLLLILALKKSFLKNVTVKNATTNLVSGGDVFFEFSSATWSVGRDLSYDKNQ